MLQVEYPKTDGFMDLTEIISIEAGDNFDTIYLGPISKNWVIGYVGFVQDSFMFKMANAHYDFPLRNSYEEVFLDVFTLMANDPDFSQEFAVLATRKFLNQELDEPQV